MTGIERRELEQHACQDLTDDQLREGVYCMSYQPLCCYDCGRVYSSDAWIEAVVSNDVWARIAPTEGNGMLCINCMAIRCVRLELKDVPVKITAGPFFAVDESDARHFSMPLLVVREAIEFLRWFSEGGTGWLTAPDKAGPLADKLDAAYRSATEKGARQ